MSIKKKLGMGVASAALGIALIGGGTFAYFGDAEATNNTFAAGTLDLSVDPTTIIDVDNLKPGDWMTREFVLTNEGTLDISKVNILTDYTVNDKNGDNDGEDFGEHIRVNFLKNYDKDSIFQYPHENVIASTTLAELKGEMPDAVKNKIWAFLGLGDERSGLKVGDHDDLVVQFEFVDNGNDQNKFQGDSLDLTWTFDAQQTKGESR
ncbi:cell division protein FtsN [Lentibacillus populi]|uniref:Cell division protein FtsN n=1 Tax=Lentibacillus populi TaxID=1827502 RepID=A0A9W5TYI4_9BACI|nr:CalY family protein [Lentibacillus populi]MBT2216907.1 M73 family metallopeptidase [Virgibacillus dakarensis]GGB45389.1 cell division protein FtsN [Lentibacillus populi]